jgi:pimeloyl-ACP methyl ester carboxylesterase
LLAAVGLYGLCLFGQEAKPPSPNEEPKPPFPYKTEDVSYPNPNAPGVQLAGTFTTPNKDSPVPAVLLIPGAGPQDRDESMAGHKPFLVLADYLTRQNVAVLRTDDRGVGNSTGSLQEATTKDLASDAEAGFRYLMSRPEVDHKRIGLIGHGEGAIAAAMVAAGNPQVAFLVLLSGTAVPGDKVLLAQTTRAETAAGVPDEQIDADSRIGAGLYKMLQQGRSDLEMHHALDNVPAEYQQFVQPWRKQLGRLETPWLRFFISYDPKTALENVKCPVLALFGEKDMTIDPDQNASAMKSAFSHGHNRTTKVKILPGLNYLFQKANTGLPAEYATIPQTMSPPVPEMISNWILQEGE